MRLVCGKTLHGLDQSGCYCLRWTCMTTLLQSLMLGHVRCAADMPVWWSWAVWLDPFSYALRGLVCNEFSAPRWDAPYNQFSSRRRRFSIGQAVLQVL